MPRLYHATQSVAVPELPDRGERARVDHGGAPGSLGEAQHPAVPDRKHGDVGVVRQRPAGDEPDDAPRSIHQACRLGGGAVAELAQERAAALPGGSVGVRLELPRRALAGRRRGREWRTRRRGGRARCRRLPPTPLACSVPKLRA